MTRALNLLELPEAEANGTLWVWGQIVLPIECQDSQGHVEKAGLETHPPKIKNLVNELKYSTTRPQDVPMTQTQSSQRSQEPAMEQKATVELHIGSWVCLWPCT